MKTYKAGELREDMLVVPVHMLEGFALVPVEVQRDADRYQWLCKQAAEDSGSVFMDRAISQLSEWVTPKHEIDSTIDAAQKGDSHE